MKKENDEENVFYSYKTDDISFEGIFWPVKSGRGFARRPTARFFSSISPSFVERDIEKRIGENEGRIDTLQECTRSGFAVVGFFT